MDIKPILQPEGIPNCSKEPPSEGMHSAIIKEIAPINGGQSFLVTFELKELDSQGKPKFVWQEFSREDMEKFKEELDKNDGSQTGSSDPESR